MGLVKEFKDFAFKGNVVELAVAVIIGGAFGKIVNSLVADVITPLLLNPVLKSVGADKIAELTWNGAQYGNFLAAIINFLCVAIVLFIVIRNVNKFNKKKEAEAPAPPAGPTQEELLSEIRDLLKSK